MESILTLFIAALDPLHRIAERLLHMIPSLLVGSIMLLIGVVLARFARDIVERVLDMVRLDDHLRRIGFLDLLGRFGLGVSMKRLSGILMHAMVLIAFIVSSANAVGLSIVPEFLRRVLAFAPTLISIMIVMMGGLFLGDLVGRVVHRACGANHIRGSEMLSRIGHGLMVLFSGIISLELLGIDLIGLLTGSMTIVLGALGLGLAIAFGVAVGMAGRDTVSHLIRDVYARHGGGLSVVNGRGRKRAKAA